MAVHVRRRLPLAVACFGVALVTATSATALGAAPSNPSHAGAGAAVAATTHQHVSVVARDEFRADMRKLWEDHITWTRMFIVSAEAGTPDTPAVAARLLANQRDISNAIRPFYGPAAAARLKSLLRHHILIAADLIGAAKAGDAAEVARNRARWYDNADDIAGFLAHANPMHWGLAEMRSMMREHLDLTLAEAVHHLQGQYVADIADYDQVHVQILHMADMLADGIVAQFPGRFS